MRWFPALAGSAWRRVAYALLALPVNLAALVAHRPSLAAGLRRRLLDHSGGRVRVVGLPLDLLSAVVAGYVVVGLVLNLAYPVRYEGFPGNLGRLFEADPALGSAWGGPTLAGAWAVHAAGGLFVFGVAGLWLVLGLTALQRKVAGKYEIQPSQT